MTGDPTERNSLSKGTAQGESRGEPVGEPQPPGPQGSGLGTRSRPRWRLSLAPAALVLPLVVIAFVAYLLIPELLSRQRSAGDQLLAPSPQTVEPAPDSRLAPQGGDASVQEPDPSYDFDEQDSQASSLVSQSRFDEAIALYESMAQKAPKEPQPEVGWARALLLADRAEDALVHARRAVELEPMNAEAMTVLAQAYLAVGDNARGLGIGQAAVELDSSSAGASAVLAEALLADGQLEQAVKAAERAIANNAQSAAAHRIRGWLYIIADEDAERALAELLLAVDLQPGFWQRHYDLGRLLLQTGAPEEALETLEQALALQRSSKVYLALAEAHYRLGRNEDASALLAQARSAGAGQAGIDPLAAAIHAARAQCTEAKAIYDRVLGGDPDEALALEARLSCEGTPPTPLPPAVQTTAPATPAVALPALQGRIAFPVWDPNRQRYDVYLSRVDGSERTILAAGARQPAFDPAGEWLLVNGERHLQENLLILRPDGSEPWEITEHAEDGLPAWSPEGKALAFSSTQHGDRQSRVYVVDLVPLDGRKDGGRVLNAGPDDARGAYPTWTSEGQIVYAGCDYASTPAVCGLLRISAEPGPHAPVAITANPADWAPAAHAGKIAFMSDQAGSWDVYIVNEDGSGLQQLTSGLANEGLPTWSPDGRTLAYVSDQGGRWAVWAMSPDGSDQRQLFEIGGGGLADDWTEEQITWAP